MDRKRVKIESKLDPSCIDDGVDRISQLPDNVIVDILSRLWFDDVASTSLLSTRWYDMWRYIPSIHFFEDSSNRGKFVEWVNSIVGKHKAHSLKNLTIYCDLDKSCHAAITKWLQFAFSKRVEVMFLSFQRDSKENAVVLGELLRLRPSNLLESSNLKSLSLTNMRVSGEAIKLILCGCHLLERLMISNVVFTSDIEVCGGATGLVLTHLEITCCSGGKWVEVSAPNLTWIKIYSSEEVLLWFENVPKLVEASFCSSRASEIQEYCFVSHLQILSIAPFCPRVFLGKDIPTMPKLMELNVSYFGRTSKYLLPTLTSFIRASPLLQTFNLQFWEDNMIRYEEDMEVPNAEAFEHQNLRLVKFYGFDVEANMDMVSFILDCCVALRHLIIEVKINLRNLSTKPNLETERAMEEADMEKLKQQIQPKLPRHILLKVTKHSDKL